MGQLTNLYVSESYQGLIKLANSTTGVTGTLQYTQDGLGNNLPIQISTSSVNITGSFTVNGLPIAAVNTGSLVTTASFNAYTSSNDSKVNSLIASTGSFVTETESGSFMVTGSVAGDTLTFTKGNGSQFSLQVTVATGSLPAGVVSGSAQIVELGFATTSSLTSLSSSIATTDLGQNNRLGSLETATGSLQNQINQKLNTGSFNSYTSSNDSKVNSLIASTGSYATTSSVTSLSQSIALTDLNQNNTIATLATTGSNVFKGLQTISGSLIVTGSITALSASITYLQTVYQTSSIIFSSGSNILGDEAGDTQTLWGKVQLPTGPLSVTGSVIATNFTGSLQGTASFASNANSASYAPMPDVSYFATTGSNQFIGNQGISGSITLTGAVIGATSIFLQPDANDVRYLQVYNTSPTDTHITASGGQIFLGDDQTYVKVDNYGSVERIDIVAGNELNVSSSVINVTGSLNAPSITGSLQGTASYATNALSSSYAQTASFASNGGVTQILAGSNIIVSPLSGQGQVTISSTGTGTGSFNTATGSYGSFYDTTTQVNPVANTPNSMSFNETAITNGVSISGSLSPLNTYIKTQNAGVYNIQFSAQVDKTDSGTDSVDIWIRKNGIDLLDTATTVTLTGNNDKSVAAWNWFVQSATNDYYQLIWASADTNMRLLAEASSSVHPGVPSVILTANRVDQFLSNTGSFNGDFNGSFTGSLQGTASFATNALSASYAPGVSIPAGTVSGSQQIVNLGFATTSSVNQKLDTGSFNTYTASIDARTGSYATTGSNSFIGQQNITGSVNITGSLYNVGDHYLVNPSQSLGFNNITSSANYSNLLFGWAGAAGLAEGVHTGSVVISGSNNILMQAKPLRIQNGYYNYVGGNQNIIGSYGVLLSTGSVLRPTVAGNIIPQAGQIIANFTTSSLAGGEPAMTINIVPNTINLQHQSSSVTLTGNIVVGTFSSFASQSVATVRPSFTTNYIAGTLNLYHISSSIGIVSQNIINGQNTNVYNNFSNTGSASTFGLSRSNINGTNNSLYVSGSPNTNVSRSFLDIFVGGNGNTVSSSHNGADNAHLHATMIYGQNLIVSASHASNIGGSTFVGRYNDTATGLHMSQDIVFAVGTGTAAATRRTGLYVTSGSLVGVSGSLNVIGNSTMTGSLGVSAGITASLQGTASYASQALTASFALNAVSTDTGSLMKTGSVASNVLTFTKGDGSTFNLTVATGSGGGSSFPFTGSAIISGSLTVTGSMLVSNGTNSGSVITNQTDDQSLPRVNNIVTLTSAEYNTLATASALDANTLYVVSGSAAVSPFPYSGNAIISGSLQVIGNSTMTGSLTISGSANPELTVIGNTILTGSVQGNVNALSISSNTASLDLNNGNFFTLQLVSGSNTFINPSNIKPGQTINILISTTGSATVSFPSIVDQVSGSSYVPTTTTSKDIITLVSFDSTNLYLANVKNLV